MNNPGTAGERGEGKAQQRIGASLVRLVLVAVVPLLVFGGGVAWLIVEQQKSAVAAQLESTARALRVAIDHELTSQFLAMEIMASDASDDRDDFAAFGDRAVRAMATHGAWLNVVLIDPRSHTIRASGVPLPNPPPPTLSPSGVDQVVKTRKPLVAGVFASSNVLKQPVVLFLTPVVRDDEVRYVLAVVMSPSRLNGIFAEQKLSASWTGAVVDNHMLLAARSRDPERYVGVRATASLADRIAASQSGMFSALNQEGATVYTVFSRSPATGWSVAIGVPAVEVDGPIRTTLAQLASVGGALMVFALFLAWTVGRNIVRGRQAFEQAQQESQARLDMAVAGAEMATWDWNIATGTLITSPRWAEMLGYRPEELPPRVESWQARVHADDLARVQTQLEQHFKQESPVYLSEHRVRRRDGSWLWVQGRGKVIERDAAGNPLRAVGTAHDISERKAAEEAIGAAAQYARSLIEASLDPLVMIDPQGKITDVNFATEKITGVDRMLLIGNDFADYFSDPQKARAGYQQVFSLGFVTDYPLAMRHRSGKITDVLYNASLYRDSDGKVLGVFAAARDVTERKQAEARLASMIEEQDAILQSEVVGFVKLRARTIVWLNQAYARMLGYTPQELTGQATRMFYPDEESYLTFRAAAYRAIASGGVYRTQIRYLRKDGTLGWFDISGAQLGDSGEDTIWAFVDISAQKTIEANLVEAQERAQQANLAKTRFLATMSHEIRTPMNGILGMAQMLQLPGIDESERKSYAQIINASGQTLLTLLNDILDLSKVEAGKLQLECAVVDPAQLVRDATVLFADEAQRKGLAIAGAWSGPRQRYWADAMRLSQMIANLTSNAIKFTESGSVRIEASEVSRQSDQAILKFLVIDSGIGIAEDRRGLLFQAFSQVDSSSTRRHGGSGLGLSIVRNLAQLMGGEVGVDSELGRGSRFWFTVRARLAEEAAGAAEPAAAARRQPATLSGRVLVVEDEPTNMKVIKAMLGKLGIQCDSADNGQQALETIAAGSAPDLVLMDCQMPIMDGYATTARLREREREACLPRLPIVALTASAFASDRERCLEAGMDDFLTKPIALAELKAALGRWLNKQIEEVSMSSGDAEHKQNDLQVFDEATLLAQLGGDRQLAKLVIASALDDIPGYFTGLEANTATGDWKGAERLAHTLKGLTAQIGGARLSQRLKEVDARLRAGEPIDVATVSELRREYQTLTEALPSWML